MAGTINLALSQQFDMDGEPLSGGLLYFYVAGTTNPQSAFQDELLTIVHPNPIVLDASGRVPMFYLADGHIKIRLTDKNGVTVIAADSLLVIGPSSGGGGGGGGVDPATVLATGDIKIRYGIDVLDGFCRCNGRTIGNIGSSATERADAACQALFEYLWGSPFTQLDGASLGASAHADWLALKRLILPDLRGRVIAGMDDMGSSPANVLTSTYFGNSPISLGAAGSLDHVQILQGNVPDYNLSVSGIALANSAVTISDPTHVHPNSLSGGTHSHTFGYTTSASNAGVGGGFTAVTAIGTAATPNAVTTSADNAGVGLSNAAVGTGITAALVSNLIGGTLPSGGSNIPFPSVQPTMVMTIYIKM